MKSNLNKIKKQISKLVSNIEWQETNKTNLFGTISQEYKIIKNEKGEFHTGNKHIFIAEMYEKDKQFFYLIYYTHSQARLKYQRRFEDYEYNKIFASGKTTDDIILDFKSKV